jgi:outer membrane receptor protein involved in Fe transport
MKRQTSTLRRISRLTLTRLPLAAAIHFACFAPAFADADADADAQTSTPAQGADNSAQKTHELDTITVTAQKRTENVQEVPISIDVLSGDKLSQMNVQNTVQVLKLRRASPTRLPVPDSPDSCAESPAAATATLRLAAERRHLPR